MYCEWPQLVRFCFCFPLRKGLLVFGYLNILFSAFMLGVYSYTVHINLKAVFAYSGMNWASVKEVFVVVYCLEFIFGFVLVYGIHKRSVVCTKVYFYFSIAMFVASLLIHVIAMQDNSIHFRFIVEVAPVLLIGFCVNAYVILSIRSFLKKLENSDPHIYENQLQRVVYERKMDSNGVYNVTTIVPEAV